MSLYSQRSSEGKDSHIYEKPSASFSNEKDTSSTNYSSTSIASQRKIFNESNVRDGRMSQRGVPLSNRNWQKISASNTSSSGPRIAGGESKMWTCKYQPPVDIMTKCKGEKQSVQIKKSTGPNVAVINVELKDQKKTETHFDNSQRQYLAGWRKRMLTKTRGTQTLYRESSAQTLPYLPAVSNSMQELDDLELFRLPTILPGDGPPGLYEVEVLERARKRWAFTKALKASFKRQIEGCKENISSAPKSHIIEAFEWEMWMEREEHIQECQMLRLEIVIRMFEKREKKMHDASRSRIAKSMEIIQAQREAGLRKNEIEYGRQLRRLEIQRLNKPRKWRKENITSMFDDPNSEFYAPQMRYGVNPNRRHFTPDQKAFEATIDMLETKTINMNKLRCPFAKLKEWSRPKRRLKEVEQNFCSDSNLKKLYDSLKTLRLECGRNKMMPKCLKEKAPVITTQPESIEDYGSDSDLEVFVPYQPKKEYIPLVKDEAREKANALMILQEAKERRRSLQAHTERRNEEIEAMLEEYEGSTVGWLMKFLSDEMHRLEEQRNLHFFTMLAQKERWRREAAEAGLRQKENDMRIIYEDLFQKSNEANIELCNDYLSNITEVDTKDYADQKATGSIVRLAKVIDTDIQRWLDSIKSAQNPLNYQMLRYLLKDIIFPDADTLIKRYESEVIIDGIIYEDIFPHVEKQLEPYDISFTISNDLVDRLIDNDLFYFSDDSSGSSINAASQQEHEARAILRKLIRRAVPGRRWMTPTERLADGNISELLDQVFESIQTKAEELRREQEMKKLDENLVSQDSYLNLVTKKPRFFNFTTDTNSDTFMSVLRVNLYDRTGNYLSRPSESDEDIAFEEYKVKIYTEDATEAKKEHEESLTTVDSQLKKSPTTSEANLEPKDTTIFLQDIIVDIIKDFIPAEAHEMTSQQLDGQSVKEKAVHIILPDDTKSEESEQSTHVVDGNISARLEDIKEEYEEESLSKLSVNESEILLLEDKRCKCKKEIVRENLIRRMLKQGRVKIIRKEKPDISSSEKSIDIETFAYESVSPSSSYREATEYEDENKSEYLTDQLDVTTTGSEFPPSEQAEAPTEMLEFNENEGTTEILDMDEGQAQPVEEPVRIERKDNVESPIDENIEQGHAPLTAEDTLQSTSAGPIEVVERSGVNEPNQDNVVEATKVDVGTSSAAAHVSVNDIESEVAPELKPNVNTETTEAITENTATEQPKAESVETSAENTTNDRANTEVTETNAEVTTNDQSNAENTETNAESTTNPQ